MKKSVKIMIDEQLSEASIQLTQLDNQKVEYEDDVLDYFCNYTLTLPDGKTYQVNVDCLESAMDKLAQLLPNDIKILCCNTCRFGHACPYGGTSSLMCLVDHAPTSKDDIITLLGCGNEHKIQFNENWHVCDKYQECSDEYYRYK